MARARLKALVRRHMNYARRVDLRGARFRVPVQRGIAASVSEPWMADLIARLAPRFPGAFVDVGVNLGQTLLALRAVDPERRYVGFEPNVACAAYVGDLARMNRFAGVTVLPVALTGTVGLHTLRFHADGDPTDPSATLVEGFRRRPPPATREILGVSGTLLDAVLPEPVGLLKIDVEGAELAVLDTLADRIVRDRPAIAVEILPAYREDNAPRQANNRGIEAFCAERGYALHRVRKGGGAVGLDPLDRIETHGDLSMCDYALLPREGPL